MEGTQCMNQRDRPTIRVRENATRWARIKQVAVYLGNDERHVCFHAKRARVVDDEGALLCSDRGPLDRDRTPRAEQAIQLYEQLLDDQIRVLEADHPSPNTALKKNA